MSYICVICGNKQEGFGNNPWPVAEKGRCCDFCNMTKVIPARFELANEQKAKVKNEEVYIHTDDEQGVPGEITNIQVVGEEGDPHITESVTIKATRLKYNPRYGDGRLCKCGHPYYRHFDTYENMAPVGCKYCECRQFEEATDGEKEKR